MTGREPLAAPYRGRGPASDIREYEGAVRNGWGWLPDASGTSGGYRAPQANDSPEPEPPDIVVWDEV